MKSDGFVLHILDMHIYPGVQMRIRHNSLPEKGLCPVEFSDGTVVLAEFWAESAQSGVLAVPSYRTARGTTIAAKSWWIFHEAPDKWVIRRNS